MDFLILYLGQVLKINVIISVLVVLIAALLLYNAYFHPLAKIPGPLSARLSGIPSWYHAFRGDRHLWLWKLFLEYGDRIRVEPNTVVFRDPDAYRDIYSTKANVQRSTFYTAWQVNKKDANTLTTIDVAEHAYKRKLLNASFTEKSVRAASEFIIRHIDRWNELLVGDNTDWSPPVDLSESVERLLFDISGDLFFGKSFETKEPGQNPSKAIPQSIEQYMLFYYHVCRSPLLDFVLWLKPRGLDALSQVIAPPGIRHFETFVYNSVSERLRLQQELGEKPDSQQRLDMFHFLCEAKNPDTGLPAHDESSLRAEAKLLLAAGTGTSATTITGAMFYLSLPSEMHRLARLVDEIRIKFASAEEIVPGPKLASCIYLRACIDEGMRLSPSGASEIPRLVRNGGITIQGEYYAAGTIVGMSGFTNGRNEKVYGDYGAFRPERWIVDEAEGVTQDDVDRARSNHHPFASGPGDCVGRNLAMIEVQEAIARTLWRFDMRRVPGSVLGGGSSKLGWGEQDPNHFRLIDHYTTGHHGPMLQFRERQI
ncbi:benzoate 4-monooxygenase cytochrome P450 [Massariosphaeria phaeospora]|uniref:Benzoate 4-monooxygenase cytochrome P450 n=1 Tax=Massariosphaeria phaeospora TaxID=100035 RepID=A0A7C8MPZ1_9PLEO|nr:benzoate 4-monooxygenase cytochrome P450 [Massariosphaeria phaeospora]